MLWWWWWCTPSFSLIKCILTIVRWKASASVAACFSVILKHHQTNSTWAMTLSRQDGYTAKVTYELKLTRSYWPSFWFVYKNSSVHFCMQDYKSLAVMICARGSGVFRISVRGHPSLASFPSILPLPSSSPPSVYPSLPFPFPSLPLPFLLPSPLPLSLPFHLFP